MIVKEYFEAGVHPAHNVQTYLFLYGGYIVNTTRGTYLTETAQIISGLPEIVLLTNCLNLESGKIVDHVTLNGKYIVSIEHRQAYKPSKEIDNDPPMIKIIPQPSYPKIGDTVQLDGGGCGIVDGFNDSFPPWVMYGHRIKVEERKCITCLFHFSNLKYVPNPAPEFMHCSKHPNGDRHECLRNGNRDWHRARD